MRDGDDLGLLPVTHVVRGEVIELDPRAPAGDSAGAHGFRAPPLDLDRLIWTRQQGLPAEGLKIDEVYDFLEAAGDVIRAGTSPHLKRSAELLARLTGKNVDAIADDVANMSTLFNRDLFSLEYEQNISRYLAAGHEDEWSRLGGYLGEDLDVRAAPTRALHILAGNGAKNAGTAIIRTALTRGVALLKLPSNDPFTVPAVLRTMIDLDPGHPIVQSISAVYWRGGDADVESVLVRPQYFEKVVAWGGEGAIKNIMKYMGPGIDVITFDPKTSISLVGGMAGIGEDELARVATLAVADVRTQEGCANSRHQFVEGTLEQVDAYCDALVAAMRADNSGLGTPTPAGIVEECEALRGLDPDYRVVGGYDGRGLVVCSDAPVEFYPEARTVNVVRVERLEDAVRFVGAQTQTAGVYPPQAKQQLRDLFTTAGVDRICNLGHANPSQTGGFGGPWDGMFPLHRLVRWVSCHIDRGDEAS
jgi:hypothetical protein